MPHSLMVHERPPETVLWDALGDVSDIEVFNNQVLVAIYKRPEMTAGGIIIPETSLSEDQFQSKVGLIVKMGPDAFTDTADNWFKGVKFSVGEWIVFRPSDGWAISIMASANATSEQKKKGVQCRILDDISVKGRIRFPDQVW